MREALGLFLAALVVAVGGAILIAFIVFVGAPIAAVVIGAVTAL